ncbi:MAG: lipopolysaccharide biosynthesis protein [Acidimicrobiales bacterium]|nr:lipopolysaccharide biosynthesis protein [Acidimicrobiales bacterium]
MIPYLIFVIRRRWPILVVLPLVVVLGVLVLSPSSEPLPTVYTTKVFVAAKVGDSSTVTIEQAALEIKQTEVATAAAKALGEPLGDPKEYAKALRVKVDPSSLTIAISATDKDRTRVLRYARAFADAFVDANAKELRTAYSRQLKSLQQTRDAAQTDLDDFLFLNREALSRIPPDATVVNQQTRLSQRLDLAEERLLEFADQPVVTPYRIVANDPVTEVAPAKLQLPSSKGIRASLALVLGVVGAIALTAFIEKLNPRIDTPTAAEGIVGAAVLAQVPVMKGKRRKTIARADLAQFSGPFAEAFRALRSHLDFLGSVENLDRPPCVMVVSSAPGEGKTTSSAFLSLSYAELGREVVVVGADFRRPAVHRLFDVPRTPGLSSRMFDSGAGIKDVVSGIVTRDEKTGVRVIPSGPGTDRVTGMLGDLAAVTEAGLEAGCTVILDTAPIMVANDAIDFLPLVDWVVVVIRLGVTTERSLRQTVQSLLLNDANIAGCVLVGSLESGDASRYYYSYYNTEAERLARSLRHAKDLNARGGGGFAPPTDAPAGAPVPDSVDS